MIKTIKTWMKKLRLMVSWYLQLYLNNAVSLANLKLSCSLSWSTTWSKHLQCCRQRRRLSQKWNSRPRRSGRRETNLGWNTSGPHVENSVATDPQQSSEKNWNPQTLQRSFTSTSSPFYLLLWHSEFRDLIFDPQVPSFHVHGPSPTSSHDLLSTKHKCWQFSLVILLCFGIN